MKKHLPDEFDWDPYREEPYSPKKTFEELLAIIQDIKQKGIFLLYPHASKALLAGLAIGLVCAAITIAAGATTGKVLASAAGTGLLSSGFVFFSSKRLSEEDSIPPLAPALLMK